MPASVLADTVQRFGSREGLHKAPTGQLVSAIRLPSAILNLCNEVTGFLGGSFIFLKSSPVVLAGGRPQDRVGWRAIFEDGQQSTIVGPPQRILKKEALTCAPLDEGIELGGEAEVARLIVQTGGYDRGGGHPSTKLPNIPGVKGSALESAQREVGSRPRLAMGSTPTLSALC